MRDQAHSHTRVSAQLCQRAARTPFFVFFITARRVRHAAVSQSPVCGVCVLRVGRGRVRVPRARPRLECTTNFLQKDLFIYISHKICCPAVPMHTYYMIEDNRL